MRPGAFLTVLTLLAPATALADIPLGSIVEDGVLVDVNEEGFSMVTDSVAALIPPSIDVPPFSMSDSSGCIFGGCAYRYRIEASNMWVEILLDEVAIIPGTNALSMHADVTVNVNSAADPGDLYVFFELAYIDIADETCDLYLDPIHLSFDVPMTLELVPDPYGTDVDGDGTPDTKRMDVVIPEPVWNWDADSDDFNFGGCDSADVINGANDVLSFFGLDLYELILDSMEPVIDDVVDAIPATVEPMIEDLFTELTISEVIDLGVPLTFTVWPNSLEITPTVAQTPGAIRIGMASAIDVPVSDCVADYVTGGALETPSQPPPVGDSGGIAFSPQISAFVDDDFANYFLYAAWAGGLLCYDLRSDDPTLELPIPLDTSLLSIIAPGEVPGTSAFSAFIPEAVPMSIVTDPRAAPVVDPSGPHDLDVVANDLGLDFVAEIDGRRARLFQAELDAVAGVDLAFDPYTGNTSFVVDVNGDSFVADVTYNELAPAASATISGQFSALFDILVAPILADATSGLFFPPMTFEGIGLLQLETAQTGPSGDWLGAYTEVGEVPYYAAGCDTKKKGKSSCDTSSCSYGCSSDGGVGVAFLGFPFVVALLRRRRSS